MAKAEYKINIELCHGRLIKAIERTCYHWPDDKMDNFVKGWRMLEDAGAEMCEVQFVGGRVVAFPSDDFTKYVNSWGIYT